MEILILFLCGLGAAVSAIAVLLPFLSAQDDKDRVRDIITERRKDLFNAANTKSKNLTPNEKAPSQQIGLLFKIEGIAGSLAATWRAKLAQAGWRSPRALIVYMTAQIILPILLAILSMVVIASKAPDLPNGMSLLAIVVSAWAGYGLPNLIVKNQAMKRVEQLNIAFPDALDLLLVCVQGGIAIEPAIDRVSREMAEGAPVLAEEPGLLGAELAFLSNRKDAFTNFATRVGTGSVRNFANALVQAEQYGTGVAKALRILSDDLRDQRMAEAERKAASLPPKLTVPMILFFLPALFIVILGPAAIQVMGR